MELAYENPSPTQRSGTCNGSAYTSAVTFADLIESKLQDNRWHRFFCPQTKHSNSATSKRIRGFAALANCLGIIFTRNAFNFDRGISQSVLTADFLALANKRP